MTQNIAPKIISTEIKQVEITGKFLPWDQHDNRPILLYIPGSDFPRLPVFSTNEKLTEIMYIF